MHGNLQGKCVRPVGAAAQVGNMTIVTGSKLRGVCCGGRGVGVTRSIHESAGLSLSCDLQPRQIVFEPHIPARCQS